jgi:hypothetical protein
MFSLSYHASTIVPILKISLKQHKKILFAANTKNKEELKKIF